jgi:hypothetical protein
MLLRYVEAGIPVRNAFLFFERDKEVTVMKTIFVVLIVLALAIVPVAAYADLLATDSIWTGSINRVIDNDFYHPIFNLALFDAAAMNIESADPSTYLFRAVLDAGSAGRVFEVSSGANFDAARALLTNGVNDYVVYGMETNVLPPYSRQHFGYISTEGYSFFNQHVAHGMPITDLTGYTIDTFSLVIDSISFRTIGQEGQIYMTATLNIYGSPVPEPSVLLLVGFGLAGLVGLGRKGMMR